MELMKFSGTPVADSAAINELLARYGVKFGIYKNGVFKEQLFPFDAIPRVISAKDFSSMEKGLIQRVDALNLFLKDIYSEGKIIKDGVIPEDFVYISKGYLAPCSGITPPKGIYSHISGIDLVQAKDGEWYILEDNLRIPSGASYPLIARELCRMASPTAFENNRVTDNRNYAALLRSTMDYVNCGGINVILTPGRYNAAYFEHSYLAEKTGAVIPCVNYYSMNIGQRFWTLDNTDINGMFPGYDLGETTQRIADGVFKEIQGYTYGVQLASFYQQGDFLPHVKLMETGFTHHSDMTDFGLPYAFVRTPRPYDTTTLNYNWQIWNTKAFSLYTNATDNIDESSAKAAVDAIIRFMVRRGIIRTRVSSGYVTEIISEDRLLQVHSPVSGICRSYVETGDEVRCGDLLCEITDPLEGNVISKIFAPVSGTVFFRCNRPLEFEKSVLFKIIRL